jgi:hypothetical protein
MSSSREHFFAVLLKPSPARVSCLNNIHSEIKQYLTGIIWPTYAYVGIFTYENVSSILKRALQFLYAY